MNDSIGASSWMHQSGGVMNDMCYNMMSTNFYKLRDISNYIYMVMESKITTDLQIVKSKDHPVEYKRTFNIHCPYWDSELTRYSRKPTSRTIQILISASEYITVFDNAVPTSSTSVQSKLHRAFIALICNQMLNDNDDDSVMDKRIFWTKVAKEEIFEVCEELVLYAISDYTKIPINQLSGDYLSVGIAYNEELVSNYIKSVILKPLYTKNLFLSRKSS